ncbi:hypothetical protein BGZ61DRAFT_466751 [Ilyonectria robusta]|uniref:uncharacterized protein n=1 Tax=Ilyonectria robusta TaxID=1079257 RepID=UPI001E8CD639|nr:uncharacterized protein BGZ61DRAFT_466751 [Ilyonectria robusta]KAH6988729.1 hypothetical protein EDB80DRAFT_175129 [Ilyonectria destructans]KAH8656394.1 hypothetical protein BGZ61DRAFT_466751 [Ilyonectria robusta]
MQLSTTISVLSMALAAAASPEVFARGGKNTACCSGFASCNVVVGDNCSGGDVLKCKTNAPVGSKGSVTVIRAFDCVDIL